jgi:cytochrome c peroxidase
VSCEYESVVIRAGAIWLCVLTAVAIGQTPPAALSRAQAYERARALAELGRKLFFDPALSGSGKLACASCHDPAFAYGPPNALPVQRGGKDLQQWGRRAAPSLKYLQIVPQFTEHYFDSEISGDDSVDGGPTGGLTWDGRVDRARAQARLPLLSPLEMANDAPAQVVASARKSKYATELMRLSRGPGVEAFFDTILTALEAWQQDYREFYPYSSKYDAWLAGEVKLSDAEQRGLQLFRDPEKGDCARCHIADRGANGTPPQFTDFALVALGVPRNREIPANADPGWYDLGLCGPERTDLRDRDEYCGRFRTPSLRNVAMRKAFFHNGVFHSLKEAVEFYVKRDGNPEKFDDLPAKYHANVETGAPFGRPKGAKPALSDEEIADIVTFLGTLTDGFRKVN